MISGRAKYWVRIHGVPLLARVWYGLGGGTGAARRYPWLGSEWLIGQLAAMPPASCTQPVRPLRIAFFTMLGSHSYMLATDIALARALRALGHQVRLVLCDGSLAACENKAVWNEGRWDWACWKCRTHGWAAARASGLDVVPVSQLVAGVEDSELQEYEPYLDTDQVVESSLYKYFKVGRLRNTRAETAAAARFREAVRVSAKTAVAVGRWKPDRVIMSHGVYSTWSPALAVFQRLDIPTAVYNKGKKRNSTVMNWVRGPMDWDVAEEWARVRDTPLTAEQDRRLDAYLHSRITHEADAYRYNRGTLEPAVELRKRLGLAPDKPTFTLFTNVLWDAASAQKEIAFPNAVDWVMETIGWFADHPEKQLVVKIHPAEKVIGTRQPFAAEIRCRFPELPPNVHLVEPTAEVNSWSFVPLTDVGLVHTSTPGMELPLDGVPVVVVSKVHYRGKGFTVDIRSKEEYFDTLGSWDSSRVDRERMRVLARRYAFLLFERYHLPWDFLIEPVNNLYTGLEATSDADLLEHPTVRMVCAAIERQTHFLMAAR